MNHKTVLVAGLCGAVLLSLVGCVTGGIASRIEEKSAVFNQLDAATQKQIQLGNIDRGYTADMVYMALGKPNKVEQRSSSSGPIGVWIYKNIPLDSKGTWRGLSLDGTNDFNPTFAPGSSSNVPNQMQGSMSNSGSRRTDVDWNKGVEVPDLPMGTLYVFFFEGRVYKLNIDQ